MLAYAASRPRVAKAQSSPNAMLIVISIHVAVVAAVMSAKMDLPRHIFREPPIPLIKVKVDPPPPPIRTTQPQPHQDPLITEVDHPKTDIPLPPISHDPVDRGINVDPGPIAAGGVAVIHEIPHAVVTPVHHGPELLTPPWQLKPPYPAAKLLSEEEATLNLRLSIDANGRVVAVDPIGRADGIFLDAARRYLLAHWRYRPAMDDGRATSSSVTITLRFMLDG